MPQQASSVSESASKKCSKSLTWAIVRLHHAPRCIRAAHAACELCTKSALDQTQPDKTTDNDAALGPMHVTCVKT